MIPFKLTISTLKFFKVTLNLIEVKTLLSEQLTIGFAHFFAYKTSLKADSVGGRGSGALPFSDLFF